MALCDTKIVFSCAIFYIILILADCLLIKSHFKETKDLSKHHNVAILCFIFILLTILVLSFELVVSVSARVGGTWCARHF